MQTARITVYRESPAWNQYDKWWMVPAPILDELFICEYEVQGERVDIEDIRRHAREVRELHPDAVLVHL